MGAVATTFVAGVEAIRKGLAKPIGSLTQMGTIRLGKRTDARSPKVKEFVPLAGLDDLVFTGWDIFEDDMYTAAANAGVLERDLLDQIKPFLQIDQAAQGGVRPQLREEARRTQRQEGQEQDGPGRAGARRHPRVQEDVRAPRASSRSGAARPRHSSSPVPVHQSLKAFEKALTQNDENIAPSMIYAYASLSEGVPFANGAPNLTVDIPVMHELSRQNHAPICGKDFKTGQTLMKTILAPGFKARMLGLSGWYSTNILGNRDGEVLDDPGSFKTKEESKLSVLEHILQPELYPDLYGNFTTRFALTITRLAVIIKRVGTTSISSDGSAIRCRSRWIFSAGIRSWPRPSCSISCSSWIWRNAAPSFADSASRNGSASTSSRP